MAKERKALAYKFHPNERSEDPGNSTRIRFAFEEMLGEENRGTDDTGEESDARGADDAETGELGDETEGGALAGSRGGRAGNRSRRLGGDRTRGTSRPGSAVGSSTSAAVRVRSAELLVKTLGRGLFGRGASGEARVGGGHELGRHADAREVGERGASGSGSGHSRAVGDARGQRRGGRCGGGCA